MSVAPPIPAGLLIQMLKYNADGVESGYRIFADGRYQSRPLGQPWSEGEPLDERQLAEARTAVAAAALETLPPMNMPSGRRYDGAVLWVQAVLDGVDCSVALVGSARQPAIDALSARLLALFDGA